MPEMYLLSGVPASGKSTIAQQWVDENPAERVRINYDALRLEMFGPDWKFNRDEENQMKTEATRRTVEAFDQGKSVVIDNTNCAGHIRAAWRLIARDCGATVIEQDLDTPVRECVRRDSYRHGKSRVGRAVIENMALRYGYIDMKDESVYPNDFVIVDMDGTLSDCTARRIAAFEGPTVHKDLATSVGDPTKYPCHLRNTITDRQCPACGGKAKRDWPLFYQGIENDPPVKAIVELVDTLYLHQNLAVVVVSGRPIDLAGRATEAWLHTHTPFPVTHLFMRGPGDSRHDFIVKEEILAWMNCKERVRYVIDDRQQVVDMWRKNGLTTLQVAEGKF